MDPFAFAADFIGLPVFMLSYEPLIHQPPEEPIEKTALDFLPLKGQHDHCLLSVNDIDSLWDKEPQSFDNQPLDFEISLDFMLHRHLL
jgi:hypothetical protein